MNLRTVLLVFATLALASIGLNAEGTSHPGAQRTQIIESGDRDLSKYEFGGLVNHKPYEGSQGNDALVREFLYSRFQSRALGYIITSSSTREGEVGYVTYFIEPDEKGVWRIVASFKRELRRRLPLYGVTGLQRRLYIAYSIEKVSTEVHCVFPILPPCATGSASDANSGYRLRLLDRAGKLIWEI